MTQAVKHCAEWTLLFLLQLGPGARSGSMVSLPPLPPPHPYPPGSLWLSEGSEPWWGEGVGGWGDKEEGEEQEVLSGWHSLIKIIPASHLCPQAPGTNHQASGTSCACRLILATILGPRYGCKNGTRDAK